MSDYQHDVHRSEHEDEFENPQPGPAGLHRGQRGVMARLAPYLIVLIVAVACGVGAFVWLSGFGGQNQTRFNASTSQSASSSAKKDSDKKAEEDKTDSNKSDDSDSAADSDSATKQDANSDANSNANTQTETQNKTDQSSTDSQSIEQQQQAADHSTAITVYNGTRISGYAAKSAQKLTTSGYSNVNPTNPRDRSTLPTANTVWYRSDADRVTAEDVAKQLGISNVVQANGIETPVAVVLMQ